ncbi:hypothetical protein F5146DRAFT_1047205, partial [Armillaria mellea]
MDLPSPRELELETALRHRNVQVAQLSDEITRLRAHVSSSSSSATAAEHTDATTASIPPQLMALLLPHIQPEAGSGSSSVTSALTQRVKGLQEENDELYDILKQGETGRLKEEVRSLKRVVRKLEAALGESHKVVVSLSYVSFCPWRSKLIHGAAVPSSIKPTTPSSPNTTRHGMPL